MLRRQRSFIEVPAQKLDAGVLGPGRGNRFGGKIDAGSLAKFGQPSGNPSPAAAQVEKLRPFESEGANDVQHDFCSPGRPFIQGLSILPMLPVPVPEFALSVDTWRARPLHRVPLVRIL